MLKELRELNQIMRKEDVLFFLQNVIGKRKLLQGDIRAICSHVSGQHQLDVDTLINYCVSLRLIECNETIVLVPEVISILDDADILNAFIIERTISMLFEANILEIDMFRYDVLNKRFAFKNERFPLNFADLRNTLISQGFFEVIRDDLRTEFYIGKYYETLISSFCKQKKKTIRIEQLKKQLEKNNKAGEQAEIYALQYERRRIGQHPQIEEIKIVSNIDVCAGYDIVSFNSNNSYEYDRFIEVKAVSSSKSFYWSINELNTAKLKGKQYYIYLVDLKSAADDMYVPTIINDPVSVLFGSEEWLIEPQSFYIYHI